MTQAPEIAFVDDDNSALHQIVLDGVRGFNRTLFANHPPGKDLAIEDGAAMKITSRQRNLWKRLGDLIARAGKDSNFSWGRDVRLRSDAVVLVLHGSVGEIA